MDNVVPAPMSSDDGLRNSSHGLNTESSAVSFTNASDSVNASNAQSTLQTQEPSLHAVHLSNISFSCPRSNHCALAAALPGNELIDTEPTESHIPAAPPHTKKVLTQSVSTNHRPQAYKN